MAYYGMNDKVEINLEGRKVTGTLTNVDLRKRLYMVHTETGDYWITQGQIIGKVTE